MNIEKKIQHKQQALSLPAIFLVDTVVGWSSKQCYLRAAQAEGKTDVSWFWQNSYVNEPKGRQSKTYEEDLCQSFDPQTHEIKALRL